MGGRRNDELGMVGFAARKPMRNDELGFVVSVSVARSGVRLYKRSSEDGDGSRVTIGRLVAINTGASRIVGVITRVSVSEPEPGVERGGFILADVDFLREIKPACKIRRASCR